MYPISNIFGTSSHFHDPFHSSPPSYGICDHCYFTNSLFGSSVTRNGSASSSSHSNDNQQQQQQHHYDHSQSSSKSTSTLQATVLSDDTTTDNISTMNNNSGDNDQNGVDNDQLNMVPRRKCSTCTCCAPHHLHHNAALSLLGTMMDVDDEEAYSDYLNTEIVRVDFMNLSEDVQVLILTYLDIDDLYRFALSCKHGAFLVLSNETDDFLWRHIAQRYCVQEGEEDDFLSLSSHDEDADDNGASVLSTISYSSLSPASLRAKLYSLFSSFVNFSSNLATNDNSSVHSETDNDTSTVQFAAKRRRTSIVIEREHNLLEAKIVMKSQDELSGLENLWRRRVRQGSRLHWEPKSRPADSSLILTNNNRTVSDNRTTKWDTIRTNLALKKGIVYYWEYSLDYHDNSDFNSYRIFVGVERSTYAFSTVGFDKIIGFNSYGVGYNIGEQCIHRDYIHTLVHKSILHQDPDGKFKAGDVITVKFDLKNLDEQKRATMELFKNGKWFLTVDQIPTEDELHLPIIYYPAISMIGKQTVTIRRGISFKELLYPHSKG